MTLLRVQPDTEYAVGYIPIKFTIPRDLPRDRVLAYAYPVLKKAIEQLERLGDGRGHHYRFRDDLPIYYRYSRLQGDSSWFTPGNSWDASAWLEQGFIDCVALLAFEQVTIVIEEEPAAAEEREQVMQEWEQQFEQPLAVTGSGEEHSDSEEDETWSLLKEMSSGKMQLS